jgi:ATP-dependent DNA helicase RecG
VEFKRDDVHPDSLAKEIVALANLRGGTILLGVEDDGSVSGLTRAPQAAETWVMDVCRGNVQPPLIPYWETITWERDRTVGIITIIEAGDKPYKARRGSAWQTFIRVGSTSREATRDEEARLYQQSGMIRYELKPVPGAELADLDMRRLVAYFLRHRQQDAPDASDAGAWQRLLLNTELMVEASGRVTPTVGGMLLFGRAPSRFLPQAGFTVVAFEGLEKDYAAKERATLRGPMAPLLDEKAELVEAGLVEQALAFVQRNAPPGAGLVDGRRITHSAFPVEAIREAVVNALVHRDYSIAGTDIELSLFADRLEIVSPGRLPNTITVERMRTGCRYARNELLKETMRDFGYLEATGMGVPRKIISTYRKLEARDPDLIADEAQFIVRLWRVDDPKRE